MSRLSSFTEWGPGHAKTPYYPQEYYIFFVTTAGKAMFLVFLVGLSLTLSVDLSVRLSNGLSVLRRIILWHILANRRLFKAFGKKYDDDARYSLICYSSDSLPRNGRPYKLFCIITNISKKSCAPPALAFAFLCRPMCNFYLFILPFFYPVGLSAPVSHSPECTI